MIKCCPPRISIVTPSYNQAKYLEECIDSILSQGYPNLEYVVMDGGSTDGSVKIIKKYEKHLTYWQSGPDEGQYAAINAGFTHTTGDIMAWQNSDDRYHPNTFLKVACTFTEYHDVDWITGIRTIWGSDGEIRVIDRTTPYFSRRKYLSGNYGTPCIQQESTFWRRRLWNQAGGCLDTRFTLAADAELWLRFFRHALLYNLKSLLGGFRLHGIQRSLLNMRTYEEEIQRGIWQELETLSPDSQLNTMLDPIRIELETYIRFAAHFDIPRFIASDQPLWKNYLMTISDSIINRKGGLQAAPIFLEEISLWERDEWNLTLFLTKKLQQQIAIMDVAQRKINEGEFLCGEGDLEGAVNVTSEAIEIWPTSADGNNNLGVLLYHKGKLNEAMEYLVQATQHDVSKREAYRNLAVIFHELGLRDKVQWALDYYLSFYPEDAEMEEFYRRLMECP